MSLLRTTLALRAPRGPLLATTSKSLPRFFSTTPSTKKDSGSAVKDTIDSVNKTVGEAAVKGIEKGQQATDSLKSAIGINAGKAEGEAKEVTGEVKGKAAELTGEAKGKGKEVAGQAKGKAEEIKGKL